CAVRDAGHLRGRHRRDASRSQRLRLRPSALHPGAREEQRRALARAEERTLAPRSGSSRARRVPREHAAALTAVAGERARLEFVAICGLCAAVAPREAQRSARCKETTAPARTVSGRSAALSTPWSHTATARIIAFFSSRTLPGQVWHSRQCT